MFAGLQEKLAEAFKKFRNKGKLTESDVKEGMRAVKMALLAIGQQTLDGPCLSFIIRHGYIHAIALMLPTFIIREHHTTVGFRCALRMISKRYKHKRTFMQSHQHKSLSAIYRRKHRSRISP